MNESKQEAPLRGPALLCGGVEVTLQAVRSRSTTTFAMAQKSRSAPLTPQMRCDPVSA